MRPWVTTQAQTEILLPREAEDGAGRNAIGPTSKTRDAADAYVARRVARRGGRRPAGRLASVQTDLAAARMTFVVTPGREIIGT